MTKMPMDFGKNADEDRWLPNNGKGLIERRTCTINAARLKERPEWQNREYIKAHWLVQPSLLLDKVLVKLVKHGDVWCIDLVEYDSQPPIATSQTRCNFGGHRNWFICPGCERRCSTLFRDKGLFRCRQCLCLSYFSQKMNYQTLTPTIRRLMKFEEMNADNRWRSYKGKPTKRELRWEKLRSQLEMGMILLGPR